MAEIDPSYWSWLIVYATYTPILCTRWNAFNALHRGEFLKVMAPPYLKLLLAINELLSFHRILEWTSKII